MREITKSLCMPGEGVGIEKKSEKILRLSHKLIFSTKIAYSNQKLKNKNTQQTLNLISRKIIRFKCSISNKKYQKACKEIGTYVPSKGGRVKKKETVSEKELVAYLLDK